MTLSVVHYSTFDGGGGAAIAARRLHDGLRAHAISSTMRVLYETDPDPSVDVVRPSNGILDKLSRRIANRRLARTMRAFAHIRQDLRGPFSDDRTMGPDPLRQTPLGQDLMHLHWTVGLVDYQRFFARLSPATPLVWTVHDMYPLTGGCHCNLDCFRFVGQCGACPLLGSTTQVDPSSESLQRKIAALAGRDPANTVIVAPSTWMAEQVKASAVFGRFAVEVIPHGLDTAQFAPTSKTLARAALGLPEHGRIVLFVADDVKNYLKGFDLLVNAIQQMDKDEDLVLVSIGRQKPTVGFDFPTYHFGYVTHPRLLALAYSAADVMVTPTRAESFGLVILEAMACGTPVVAFAVGGVPDLVKHELTGLLVPPDDAALLSAAIRSVLDDDALRESMGQASRELAVNQFALDLQVERHVELYRRLAT